MTDKSSDEKDLDQGAKIQESSKVISIERAKGPYRKCSMSDLRLHMKSHFKKVLEGSPEMVTFRGKPIAFIEAIQQNLPMDPPKKLIDEFNAQLIEELNDMESRDPIKYALKVQAIRKLVGGSLLGGNEKE